MNVIHDPFSLAAVLLNLTAFVDVWFESFVEVGCAPAGNNDGNNHKSNSDDGEDRQ